MNPDILRWNQKYRAASPDAFAEPDALLRRHRSLLAAGGHALDVACGAGANAIFAARCGYRVCALDASIEGLRIAARRAGGAGARLHLANVDLERYRPPRAAFDLIMMIRFLDRSLLGALSPALRPGGLLICKTFNRNFLDEKPDFSAGYVLEPGELRRRFADLEPLAVSDGESRSQTTSFLIGRKRAP